MTDDVHEEAVDAAMAVFERVLRLYTPNRVFIVEAVAAAQQVFQRHAGQETAAALAEARLLNDELTARADLADSAGDRAAAQIRQLRADLAAIGDLAYRARLADLDDDAGRAAVKDALHTIQNRAGQAAVAVQD